MAFFLFTDHLGLTRDPAFVDNALYLLLEDARPRNVDGTPKLPPSPLHLSGEGGIMRKTSLARGFAGTAALLAALATDTTAQVADKKVLTLDGAKKVAAGAAADARQHNIAVVDDGGNLMYLERLDNTFAAGARISIGKARTAALFKKPTAAFEEIIRNGRTPMIALEDFTPLQGGVPLELDGKVIGAIGVSGAANQQRDEEVAKAGAAALK